MKIKKLFILLILFPFLFASGFAQNYNKMKITLSDGPTITGKKGTLSNESVSCLVGGELQTYSLGDIKLVSAKKGSAGKWAAGMGGCCLGACAFAGLLGDKDDLAEIGVGPYIGASLFLSGLTAGFGYLIGALTDPWKNVYIAKFPVAINRIKPLISVDPKGRPLFGFAYSL
jgi:hypothetical protein